MLQSGSGMALGTSHQTDTSQQGNENASQWKTCQCEEGEGSLWSCKLNDDNEKHATSVRCSNCQNLLVFKSGHMLISSKGLGWTSWKRRWFMLTRESLIFFRSDPNAPLPPQQRGNELNLYLDTIELNNSGSVVAKADKKLLTVNFLESRDGRTFTLKAETSEDLQEWKNVLDIAISQAPSPPVATGGQSTTSQNDETNDDGSQHSVHAS
ncbi:hypothetical protein ZOSMA_216G00180 [Zostera marina]|uniref:PH domain-containing protein n=1 Tax=Zostera marina TaxID=29655 RepID=A0A0K9PJW5_ZOSMR|nr:hypothetical protein ZOSMA_216G00180 [Zostera marina]